MKTLLASAILLSTTSAFAHDTNFSSDSCDVDLNAGLRINKNVVEFTKNDNALYQILNNETLVINGEEITLDANQQALVTEYSTNIRAILPEVKAISVDAIELAVNGVNLAFDELLGEGNDLGEDLTTQLYGIRDEVEQRFDSEQEFYIDEQGELSDDFLGAEFEERIESIVETTVKNSLGTLLIAVGQEMLFSGGDMGAFETRMENFGDRIENEMESRGQAIEKRGEALCLSVYKIDQLEGQLQENIDGLADFDVITATVNGNNEI